MRAIYRIGLQFDIEQDNVLVVPVLHEKAPWNAAQLREAQALIQVQGMDYRPISGGRSCTRRCQRRRYLKRYLARQLQNLK